MSGIPERSGARRRAGEVKRGSTGLSEAGQELRQREAPSTVGKHCDWFLYRELSRLVNSLKIHSPPPGQESHRGDVGWCIHRSGNYVVKG